jgi:glycosyltransferase involved in cell wall biosynthesis
MRIAQLAPLAEPVPPAGYGGTELIVSLLTEELIKRGHDVTLFASGDSKTNANLISVAKTSLRADNTIPMRRWSAYDMRNLLELEARQNEFDIVHNHTGYQALLGLRHLHIPSVSTNHNQVKDYCKSIYMACSNLPYVSISQSYQKLNYPNDLNYVATIYNGIDVANHIFNSNDKRDYLLFLGRICHDKGTAIAIDIANSLGLPLKIAGKIDSADDKYWQEEVKPKVKGPNIEYLGEVNFDEKNKLYSNAIALVYPITFSEPFGLVMVEALACGTPVLALDKGSVKEILVDGEIGIIANSKEEIVKRFKDIEKIDRNKCRQRVEKLFSKERMANEYEAVYKRLCK